MTIGEVDKPLSHTSTLGTAHYQTNVLSLQSRGCRATRLRADIVLRRRTAQNMHGSYIVLICLCVTHVALGASSYNDRALPTGSSSNTPNDGSNGSDQRLGRQSRGDPWWWGGRGGLRRAAGGGYRRSDDGCLRREGYVGDVESSGRVGSRVPNGVGGGTGFVNLPAASINVAALKLARFRAGAGGGYNYDDDYYEGPEEPYREDAGGWGDEGRGRNGREGRYNPYDDGRPPKRGRTSGPAAFDLTGTITKGNKKYGIYALGGSILLTMMGVSLMFEKNLIRLGNLGFVTGMALFIGPSNVVRYFTQASKLRGSIIFAVGFFFVFTGHPIVGLAIEVFGFLNLFGNLLPMIWAMASSMPFVKDIVGSGAAQRKKAGKERQKRPPRPPPSRYYDDGYGYEDPDGWNNGGGGGGGRDGGDWGYDDYDPYQR